MPVNTLNRRAFLQLGGSAYLGTTLPQLGRWRRGRPNRATNR